MSNRVSVSITSRLIVEFWWNKINWKEEHRLLKFAMNSLDVSSHIPEISARFNEYPSLQIYRYRVLGPMTSKLFGVFWWNKIYWTEEHWFLKSAINCLDIDSYIPEISAKSNEYPSMSISDFFEYPFSRVHNFKNNWRIVVK